MSQERGEDRFSGVFEGFTQEPDGWLVRHSAICGCCQNPVSVEEAQKVAAIWEGRMDGYCEECSWARCDAFPGECPREFAGVASEQRNNQ